jgi:ribosomal protein L7/L12
MTKEEIVEKITDFLASGNKLMAVKWVIDNTGWGLKQSKDLVDEVEAVFIQEKLKTGLGATLEQQVRSLIDSRNLIEAIKLVKETLNIGLKEAKDIVDNMQHNR